MLAAAEGKCELLLPTDHVVADSLDEGASASTVSTIPDGKAGFDVGPATIERFRGAVLGAKSVFWNGPLGAFETPPFDQATNRVALKAARLAKSGKLLAVAGGGDTVAALNVAGATQDFTYVSTAGGAFLEWLEGKTLPGIAALIAAPKAA